jgi:hypothetical protein
MYYVIENGDRGIYNSSQISSLGYWRKEGLYIRLEIREK